MNEALIIPLLKDYITANNGAELEETLTKLTEATGYERELVFDILHQQFPTLHDTVVNELKEDGAIIKNMPIYFKLF